MPLFPIEAPDRPGYRVPRVAAGLHEPGGWSALVRSPVRGRQGEVGALLSAAAAAAAAAGAGGLVLVGGEPGIGKTHLVRHIAHRTAANGELRALRASCWEGQGVPAFWPWTQLLRAYARDSGPAEPLVPGSARDPGSASLALMADAVEALRRDALTTPLPLVIDDLQWADLASLHLLRSCPPRACSSWPRTATMRSSRRCATC